MQTTENEAILVFGYYGTKTLGSYKVKITVHGVTIIVGRLFLATTTGVAGSYQQKARGRHLNFILH